MSIPRYKINPLFGYLKDAKEGKFCEYRDYLKLEKECSLLRDTISNCMKAIIAREAENARIKAEVERLTKAGDAMADSINGDYNYSLPCIEEWKAAKEGKPKNSKDALEFIHTLDSLAIKKQKEEIERLCAWGRGLESDLSHARVEISFLKAESERLKEDNRQLTNAFEIAEGIIKRMGKAAEAAAKEGKSSV